MEPTSPQHLRQQRLRRTRILRWRKRFFKHLPPVTIVLFIFIVVFGSGFVWFSEKVTNMAAPANLPPADAIIVLTGGQARLGAGLQLLEQGHGKRLLVTGVNPATDRQDLIRITNTDPALFACCVDLGYEAIDTIGNAAEAQTWVQSHQYQSLYIVTNDYHMLRSLREMQSLMPDVQLIAYPVKSISMENKHWISNINLLRLLMSEYVKFIAAEIRRLFI